MRSPNPRNYDSDWDYYEACEAYRAYLNGEPHPAQPMIVQQRLDARNPDSNHFEYD